MSRFANGTLSSATRRERKKRERRSSKVTIFRKSLLRDNDLYSLQIQKTKQGLILIYLHQIYMNSFPLYSNQRMLKIRKRLEKFFRRKNVSSTLTFDNSNEWQHLNYLNLSNCEIANLPRELGALPHLERLVLSNNNLGSSDKFKWLRPTAIRNNLRFLDLSNNSLIELPIFIGKLIALRELIVCHNSLIRLPQSIANLRNLEVLKSSNNKLLYLPGSITNMRLKFLDISKNDFFSVDITIIHTQLLTLRSLAAKVILKNRSVYDISINMLLEYLEKTDYCLYCNNPHFESYVTKFLQLDPFRTAATVILDDTKKRKILSFECYYCSLICYKLWWIRDALRQRERQVLGLE